MSKTNLAKLILFLVIVGVVLYFALRLRTPHPVVVGDSAPRFILPSLSRGTIGLSDFRGQVIVLNFWATWCPPCIEETPSLENFAVEMREKGVTVIGVSVDEDRTAVQKFVERFRVSYPIALDSNQTVATRYGTFKFPETYIIDRNGKVVEKVIGAINWQDPRMLSFIQDLARGLTRQGK